MVLLLFCFIPGLNMYMRTAGVILNSYNEGLSPHKMAAQWGLLFAVSLFLYCHFGSCLFAQVPPPEAPGDNTSLH